MDAAVYARLRVDEKKGRGAVKASGDGGTERLIRSGARLAIKGAARD
jgi:hypothetical protein